MLRSQGKTCQVPLVRMNEPPQKGLHKPPDFLMKTGHIKCEHVFGDFLAAICGTLGDIACSCEPQPVLISIA